MLMVNDENKEASASAKQERKPGQAAAPLNGYAAHDDMRADIGQDDEEGRSLAFVYIIVAFVIALGAMAWAVSAFL